MTECGCGKSQSAATSSAVGGAPTLEPPTPGSELIGENIMTDAKPTLIPPAAAVSEDAVGASQPTQTPGSALSQGDGGVTAWLGDKRVSALWSINQNRNSWAYISNVGWKRFADNSDSAIVAFTSLAAHAKQTQTNFSYREEADGKIHEVYVW